MSIDLLLRDGPEDTDRDDGWARVLEQVSTTCPILPTHMMTPLKYWKTEGLDDATQLPTACLDYALDEQPVHGAEGDGRIVVDEGFIRMTSTGRSASRIRVRTTERLSASVTPRSRRGDLRVLDGIRRPGHDMILDGVAQNAKNDPTADGLEDVDVADRRMLQCNPENPPSEAPPATAPDTSRRAVVLAVDMVNECIDDMSTKTAAIAAKWATGTVPIAEMIDLQRRIGDPVDHRPLALFGAAARPGARGRQMTIDPKTRVIAVRGNLAAARRSSGRDRAGSQRRNHQRNIHHGEVG